jgi:DNA-binding LacI/PurR family transcriptional regulator
MERLFQRLTLDSSSQVSFIGQISGYIALLIADGELEAGARLPAIRALAQKLGVNVNTVRAAFARLEADGLVTTRHGVGTTVLPVGSKALAAIASSVTTNTVGVLIAGLDPFYLDLLKGIEGVAAERGTLLLIVNTRDSEARASTAIHQLVARGVDGIIAVSVGGADPGERGDGGPPIVYVDQPNRDGHSLTFDGIAAGELATNHLLKHGHNRIGFITASLELSNQGEVFEGYVGALRNAGLKAQPELLAEVDQFTVVEGQRGLKQLLANPDPPTAVVASASMLAIGVLLEAGMRSLAIPKDLALIGYAEDTTPQFTKPALTMISVPAEEAGARAMIMLRRLIDDPSTTPHRDVLEVKLMVRESCGPHAKPSIPRVS